MKLTDVMLEIWRVTDNEQKSLLQMAAKAGEEVGELLEAVLSSTGAPGCNYKGKTRDDVDEEAVDVILCAGAALFLNTKKTQDEIAAIFEKKIEKWKTAIERERVQKLTREIGT